MFSIIPNYAQNKNPERKYLAGKYGLSNRNHRGNMLAKMLEHERLYAIFAGKNSNDSDYGHGQAQTGKQKTRLATSFPVIRN